MPEKKVLIQHGGINARIKFDDYDSLMSISKKKLNISAEFHLEYEEDGKWIAILDDDDVEDLPDQPKLRVVMKKDEGASFRGGNNTAIGGAAAYHGNALYTGGDVSGSMVGGSVSGKAMVGKTVVKVGKQTGNVNVKDQTIKAENVISGSNIQGDGFNQTKK